MASVVVVMFAGMLGGNRLMDGWCGQTDGVTPLYIACEKGHDMVVRTLLASGTNVNQALAVSRMGVVVCG